MADHHCDPQPPVPLTKRTRRVRPVTYQLDLSQRRNSEDEPSKSSPRPQLHRAPRSSPVVVTRQSLANCGEALGANAGGGHREAYSSTLTPTFLPRLSFGDEISPKLSNILNNGTSIQSVSQKPRLRRTTNMSNSQDSMQVSRCFFEWTSSWASIMLLSARDLSFC